MYRIFLLYALSGFVSLGYQVAWFRIFNDWFGSTSLTFALVVCCFIGGLGLGALLSRRLTGTLGRLLGLRDPLRVYGVVEILVGLAALLTVVLQLLPGQLWGDFPYTIDSEGFFTPTAAMQVFQLGAAIVCLTVPCLFMGATYPLLCHAFVGEPGASRLPSALYAWNTLGACSGVLVCQFLLIPVIGHGGTFWLMAGLNILLGAYFLASGGAPDASPAAGRKASPSSASHEAPAAAGMSYRTLVACAALSGLVAGSLEGDLFKRIAFLIASSPGATMSFISFWAILGIFLASTTVQKLRLRRLLVVQAAFVLACIYYGVVSQIPVLDGITNWAAASFGPNISADFLSFEFRSPITFPTNMLQLLAATGVVVLPPFFLVSLLLPCVCDIAQSRGRHLGVAYGVNTLAFCIGLISFTLLAPQVNIFFSTKLFIALLAIATLMLCSFRETGELRAWQPLTASAALGAAIFLTPAHFDRSYFHPNSPSASWQISALRSDGNNTTYVAETGGIKNLFFGRLNMTGTNFRAQAYMRQMAHFPLFAQSDARRALLICFGVGNTASAIATHSSIESIDIVDLNKNIFRTAPEFTAWNQSVYADERVRLINDDGRHFLRVSGGRYDLITSEPPPPMAAGIYRLYSREYYEDALAHLTDTGMMTQWLPIYQMPPEAVELAVATFIDVFPHALLFSGWENDLILLGSRAPINVSDMEQRYNEMTEPVRNDLLRASVGSLPSLLGRIIETDDGLRRDFGAARTISDQHNDLEHMFLKPVLRTGMPYAPDQVYRELGMESLNQGEVMYQIMHHLGRLRFNAGGFPYESMANVSTADGDPVQLADVDWIQVRRFVDESVVAFSRGDNPRAVQLLNQGLAMSAEQPELQLNKGKIQFQMQDFEGAVQSMRQFTAIETGTPGAYLLLGSALRGLGQTDEALEAFSRASELAPGWVDPLRERAWILAAHPDPSVRKPGEATALAREVISLAGSEQSRDLIILATALAANQQFDEATRTLETAIDATSEGDQQKRAQLQQVLTLIEKGEPLIDQSLAAPVASSGS